jgi:hypothetical protein
VARSHKAGHTSTQMGGQGQFGDALQASRLHRTEIFLTELRE